MEPVRRRCLEAAHELLADQSKCQFCMDYPCEQLVPGFIATNHGRLVLSKALLEDESVHRAALDVLDSCPVSAIRLCPILSSR